MKVLLIGNDEATLEQIDAKMRARGLSVLRRKELQAAGAATTASGGVIASLDGFGLAVVVALGGRGLGAAASVRALRAVPGGEVPVILVVSDEPDVDALEALVESGASDFLQWPRDAAMLTARLAVVEARATERRKARAERREVETRYQALLDRTPALMHTTDRDGCITSVSDAWLELLGYERRDVLGRMAVAFLSEQSRKRLVEEILPVFMQSGVLREERLEFMRKDGKRVAVRVTAVGQRSGEGKVLGALVVGVKE